MKPAAFRYHAPKTIDEAVALLAEFAAEDGRVLAGGQSLVPTMAFRLAKPAHLVDINGVEALNRIAVAGGKLVIGARDFFKGIMTTALRDDELLVEARLPLLPTGTRCGFYEFSRRAGDFALAAAVGLYRLDGGNIAEPRLAPGGVEVNPRRIAAAERALDGAAPGDQAFRAAAQAATSAIDPMEDVINSAEFRRDLVLAIARRALERAAA